MSVALNKLRDQDLSRKLLSLVIDRARQVVDRLGRKLVLMEVCGTHTMAFSRSGLRSLLKETLELRSGPGCPVCVTAAEDVDAVIALARLPGVTVAVFGDLIRVPGSRSSLEEERARGARVRVVYSPLEAVELAAKSPAAQLVFVGLGFETTAPLIALGLAEARQRRLNNFNILSSHKLMPPALNMLLAGPGPGGIDGLLLPGHVSVVTGRQAFDFIAGVHGVPAVVTGFEPLDLLGAVLSLLDMVEKREPKVVNGYQRVVREEGNPRAKELINTYFRSDQSLWRGLGPIPGSGLYLQDTYREYDAGVKFKPFSPVPYKPSGCCCGDVLRGRLTPLECPLFAGICTPACPSGPCMVSSEGACAVYYKYEQQNNLLDGK